MAADYTRGRYEPAYTPEQFEAQQASQMAPAGLRQESARWSGPNYTVGLYSPLSYGEDTKAWLGGRNVEGVSSGWSSDFIANMFTSYGAWTDVAAKSRENRDPGKWLDFYDWLDPDRNPAARDKDLFAFWDAPMKEDGTRAFKRGDIVRNGVAVPGQNVYEVFDQKTGDLLIGEFMFGASEKARFNRDADPAARYQKEVEDRADEWSRYAAGGKTARDYQEDVYRTKQGLSSGADIWAPLATAGGTALIASPLLLIPVAGPFLYGGAVVAGGAAGYANQDALVDAIAHGEVQADMAREKYGNAAWFTSTLTEYGNVGTKLISPFSNVVQGGYDAFSEGGIGDGRAEFQEVDMTTGQRRAPLWVQGLDVAASFGDGLVQFAGPAGQISYLTTMGASTLGNVGTLAATGGLPGGEGSGKFDLATGQWVELKGGQFTAALGSVAIDALQLGMGAAVGQASRASRQLFGLGEQGAAGALSRARAPKVEGGRKFWFDETGQFVVRSRATWTLLAPSEAIHWVAVSWRARNLKNVTGSLPGANVGARQAAWTAEEGGRYVSKETADALSRTIGRGMVTHDDLYRAALELHSGSTLQRSIINGWAEAVEEGVQGFLDPISLGEQIDPSQVLRSMAYGFASGAGMATGGRTTSAAQKQEARAKANWLILEGRDEVDEDEWRKVYWGEGTTESDRQRLAIMDVHTQQTVRNNLSIVEEMHKKDRMTSSLPMAITRGGITQAWEEGMRNLNPAVQDEFVVLAHEGSAKLPFGFIEGQRFRTDDGVLSLKQMVLTLESIRRGLDLQRQSLEDSLRTWQGAVLAEQASGRMDKGVIEHAEAMVKKQKARLASWPRQMELARMVQGRIDDAYDRWRAEADEQLKLDIVADVNAILGAAYDGTMRDRGNALFSPEDQELLRRAVELRVPRGPHIDAGSYAGVFRPQVGAMMSALGMERTILIHQTFLKPMGADHDGDHLVVSNYLYVDDDELEQLRDGFVFLEQQTTVEEIERRDSTGQPVYEPDPDKPGSMRRATTSRRVQRWKAVTDPIEGFEGRVEQAADAIADLSDPIRGDIVRQAQEAFEKALIDRFTKRSSVYTEAWLTAVLMQYRDNIRDRIVKADSILLDELVNRNTQQLMRLRRSAPDSQMTIAWIKERQQDMWEEIHTKLAVNAGANQVAQSTGVAPTPVQETRFQHEVAVKDAASDGMTLQLALKALTNPTRKSQVPYYFPFFRATTLLGWDEGTRTFTTDRMKEVVDEFHKMATGHMQSAFEDASSKSPIEDRVMLWLLQFMQAARQMYPEVKEFNTPHDGLVLIANMRVPDIGIEEGGDYLGSATTMVQLLLKKSIQIEELKQEKAPPDAAMKKRIARLKGLTQPQGPHSTTANRALFAVTEFHPMYRLSGKASDGIGGHLTPHQLMHELLPLSDAQKQDQEYKWKHLPAYTHTYQKGVHHDPPYGIEDYASGRVSAFSMMVDAITAEADYVIRDRKAKSETKGEQFRAWFDGIRTMRESWGVANHERLLAEAKLDGETTVTDERILDDFLDNNTQVRDMLGEYFGTKAYTGIFKNFQGEIRPSNWLRVALLEKSSARAEHMIEFHGMLAELNALSGEIRYDPVREDERREIQAKGITPEILERARARLVEEGIPQAEIDKMLRPLQEGDAVPDEVMLRVAPHLKLLQVDPNRIESRLALVAWRIISEDQTGLQWNRFLDVGLKAQSTKDFYEAVNGEHQWVGDMRELIPYYDDVSDFTNDLSDVWSNGGTRSQQLREVIEKSEQRMQMISSTFAASIAATKAEAATLNRLEQYYEALNEYNAGGMVGDEPAIPADIQEHVRLVGLSIANKRQYSDLLGIAARDQYMAAGQDGKWALQDKGLPDANTLPVGVAQVVVQSLVPYKAGPFQEMDALTSIDWRDIQSNISALIMGPVRIGFDDGSTTVIDFSDPLNIVRLFKSPRTRPLGVAILATSIRDVDANNQLQTYTYLSSAKSNEHTTPFIDILRDGTYAHLFPTGRLEKLTREQAAILGGLIESGARAKAKGGTERARNRAENILQLGYNEHLIAYSHQQHGDTRDLDAERADIPVNYLSAQLFLMHLSPRERELAKEYIELRLKERYLDLSDAWPLLSSGRDEINAFDLLVTDTIREDANAKKLAAGALLSDPDPAVRQAAVEETDRLNAVIDELDAQLPLWERMRHLPPSAVGAIHQWVEGINDPNPDVSGRVRLAALDFLRSGERINGLVEKGQGDLVMKVNAALANDPKEIIESGKILPEEWTLLGLHAATHYIIDASQTVPFGLGLKNLAIGDDGDLGSENEQVRRLYDLSWASLTDRVWDPQALEQLEVLARANKFPAPGIGWREVADKIHGMLYHESKMGPWTPLNVTEYFAWEQALNQSPVLTSIQRTGPAPVQMQDIVGTQWLTYTLPDQVDFAKHHTTSKVVVHHSQNNPGLWQAVIDPFEYMKIEHHFATEVRITGPGGQVHNDVLKVAGEIYGRNTDIAKSKYRILHGDWLQNALETLQRTYGEGDYTIEIDYVDVDKKDYSREYVNSVLFDGVDPTGAAGLSPGAVAGMMFGTGMINKQGQQRPLDMAAKAGKKFWQVRLTDFRKVQQTEARNTTIARVLYAKTAEMWGKEYETGHIPLGGNNAIYKWMKARHAVAGLKNGVLTRMGAEQAILLQERAIREGRDPKAALGFDNNEFQLVSLTERQSQTILGHSGPRGTMTAQEPVLNVEELDPLPSYDNERMRQLGLEGLGTVVDIGKAEFGSVVPQLIATAQIEGRGNEHVISRGARFVQWQVEKNFHLGQRQASPELVMTGPNSIYNANRQSWMEKTRGEQAAQLISRTKMPFVDGQNTADVLLSDYYEKAMKHVAGDNPSAIPWIYTLDGSSNHVRGILGHGSLESNFKVMLGERDISPTYGDPVLIDLDLIVKWYTSEAGGFGSLSDAERHAREAIRALADRGVTITLGAKSEQKLRGLLAQWMATGEVGYMRMHGTSHWFEPSKFNAADSTNVQAVNSTSNAVQQFTPGSMVYIVKTAASKLSEGAVAYDNEQALQYLFSGRISAVVPAALMATTQDGQMAWNLPVNAEGLSSSLQYAIDYLLPKLEDPSVRGHLKRLSGGKDGNPGHPVDIVVPDHEGKYDEGVLSFDDAFDDFVALLRAGKDPLEEGRTLRPGDFYIIMSSKNEIMLGRYGFKIPDGKRVQEMLQAPFNEIKGKGDGRPAIGIAIFGAEMEDRQTVPPPIRITRIDPDKVSIRILGDYDLSIMTKTFIEGTALKLGRVPMPAHLAFADEPVAGNGLRFNELMTRTPASDKQATGGDVTSIQEALAFGGYNLERYLVEYFYGPQTYGSSAYADAAAGVKEILNAWSGMDWGPLTDKDLEQVLDIGGTAALAAQYINDFGKTILGAAWTNVKVPEFKRDDDPVRRFSEVVLMALMKPDITPDLIMGSAGMATVEDLQGTSLITLVPGFFARALGNHRYPNTRAELFNLLNANIRSPQVVTSKGELVPTLELRPDFTFALRMKNPQTGDDLLVEDVILQRATAVPFEKGAERLAASARQSKKGNVSPHNAAVAAGAISAWTAAMPGKGLPTKVEAMLGANAAVEFDPFRPGLSQETSLHHIINRVRAHGMSYSPWERRLPEQQQYVTDARMVNRLYVTPIAGSPADVVTTFSPAARQKAMKFLEILNLDERSLYEVDILVRQFVGRRGAKKAEEIDVIDEETYIEYVQLMINNVENYMHPLHGASVPMEGESFWAKVYDAQRAVPAGKTAWAPVAKKTWKTTEFAPDTYEGWVDTLLGQVRHSNAPFHGMYKLDLDSFLHTYQGRLSTFKQAFLSFDHQRELLLLDPATNSYRLSLDPVLNEAMGSPMLFDRRQKNLDTLTGHDTDLAHPYDASTTPMSTMAEELERKKEWLRTQKINTQRKTTVLKFHQEGLSYRENSQNTINFISNLNHLQIIVRMANPGIFFSGFFEVPAKNFLEHMTDLASGMYAGPGAAEVAGRLEKAGLKPVLSAQDIRMVRELSDNMGSKTKWHGFVFKEIFARNMELTHSGPGRISQFLERTAGNMARIMGDPHLGMRARTAAYRYNLAAIEFLRMTDSSISVAQYYREMSLDPLWFHNQYPEGVTNPSTMALNRIAAVRGTKQSYINKFGLGWIDKLGNSGSAAAQFAGFLLNVPFKFKRFTIGTFLTITGLQAFDQMFAMMRDARPKTTFVGRLQASMRGDEHLEGEEDVPLEFTDHSDVIDSMTLVRPFIKGGIQQTMLLAAGLFAGQLNLDGEDEEEKRRRRLMRYMHGAYLYDPREAENDFLYADALFLDSIDPLKGIYKDESGRAAVQPHWILRQFTSPMMGVQRFMNTGDFREVLWGFQDAVAVVPNSAIGVWDNAWEASRLLTLEAQDVNLERGQTPEGQNQVQRLLLSSTYFLEKSLLELSVVNNVRNGADTFDRDPYAVVKRDETGNVVFNDDGTPARSDTLFSYVDPVTGETKQAYEKHPEGWFQGDMSHAYAEKNTTWAILASLFTGQLNWGQSSFNRKNMPVKEVKIEVPELNQEQAEALILAAYAAQGGQVLMTKDEIIRSLKFRYEQADVFWDQAQIEQEADAVYEAQAGGIAGMSLIDEHGDEVFTQPGARAVYDALRSGQVTWTDAVLEGVVIPWEMREQIAKEWQEELIQEGVDMGMPEQTAMYYARRVWSGDTTDPTRPSLKELLRDKRIPGDGTVKYNQLNMTYMIGPDGRPVATPFKAQTVAQAFGIPFPSRTPASGPGMTKDIRGKSVDAVLGINTGLHGLVRQPFEEWEPPEDLYPEVTEKTYTPGTYTRFGRRGYGGGGGGGYASNRYYDRMQPLPRGASADLANIQTINAPTPYIRRPRLERQRITSERERLKQWQ